MENILPGLMGSPNVHPLFVHFPLALWPTALLFYILGVFRKREILLKVGRWLLYLGTLSALTALATGLWASQSMGHSAPGHEFVHNHRNWMIGALSLSILATITAIMTRSRNSAEWNWTVTGLLLAAVVVMTIGADRGANLVYRYGIGTAGEPLSISIEDSHSVDYPA